MPSDNAVTVPALRGPAAADAWLHRYAPIVDDPEAFLAATKEPLPRVVWANPLRAPVSQTNAEIRALVPNAQPVRWRPNTWRLPPETQPGTWLAHLHGDICVQEEAALWAGDLVGAQPGDRVLDLCAAPGGKTAQIAVAMQDSGTIVANERKHGRLARLRRTLDRLGVTCAAVTCGDGARIRSMDGFFDRTLVDVPCTCEGTTRKSDGRREAVPTRYRDSIVQIQKSLLRAALRMSRPGGTVIYSTCTYAPEENEAVLSAIRSDQATIEPLIPPPGLQVSAGLPQWQGEIYRPDVVNAARLWPHHNDTGGFFVARLRRL
ncbi:MAG: RsmB/NOP family class I SAM-dependent RNA methyltransferase [Myxococcales bacterium]|nr:RsmB/NOP family class I SAM-dependent RNA methyltransferase [Myxococcales bacterium]